MSVNSNTYSSNNPWNGLRTYYEGEVIYGRSEEIHVLSLLILQSHQTVVYGRSGIGKSSILNAGIFPIIRKHGVFPVYIRFEHNVEVSYLDQIKNAIRREIDKAGGKIKITKRIDKTGEESLWEFFHRIDFHDEEGNMLKPMVVFDQFEEIFTLEKNKEKVNVFFRQLADLINNVMPEELVDSGSSSVSSQDQDASDEDMLDLGLDLFSEAKFSYKSESDYHLVFTLREDFLSYLERNTTDIPELKNNRYCLQPINDEQAAEIIMQPRPGLVDTKVAKLIIEKVTGEKDFEIDGIPEIQVDSAILSLYLSRLYDKMISEGESKITSELVEAHSDNIIEDFYNDAISNLPKSSVEWMEDTLINNDGRRDNRDRSTVIWGSGLSDAQLDSLINDIKLLRQFSYGGDLRIEYIHDVLCPVIVERRRKRKEDQRVKSIEDKAKIERRKSRSKILAILLFFVVLALLVGGWLYRDYYLNEKPYEKYYSEFSLVDGWPVGEGEELTSDLKKKTPLFYRLSKKGHKAGPFTVVEAVSSVGTLSATPKFDLFGLGEKDYTDKIAASFFDDFGKVSRLEFIEGSDGQIDRVIAKADNDSTIFLYTYFHLQPKPNAVSWISFLTPDGRAKAVNDSGIDRIMIALDSLGRIDSYMYYDQQRIRTSLGKVYGKKFVYGPSSDVSEFMLDNFAIPISNADWNAVHKVVNQDTVTYEYRRYSNNFNDNMYGRGPEGAWKVIEVPSEKRFFFNTDKPDLYTKVSVERDDFGRIVRSVVVDNPTPLLPDEIKIDYDINSNNVVAIAKLAKDGKTMWKSSSDSISKILSTYDKGMLLGEEVYSGDKRIFLSKKQVNPEVIIFESENKLLGEQYVKQIDSISEFVVVTRFYDEKDNPINVDIKFFEYSDPQKAHKIIKEKVDGDLLSSFFIASENGLKLSPYVSSNENTPLQITSKKEAFDDLGNRTKLIIYDENGNIRKSMMYTYKNGVMHSRSAMGIDGNPVRSDDWEIESYGYYKMLTVLNENNQLISVRAINEFDQPSVLYDPYRSKPYIKWSFNKYILPKSFTLSSGEPVNRAFVQPDYYFTFDDDKDLASYKVAYLHILDKKSPLYGKLMDGDRIIGIDKWKYSKDLLGFDKAWLSMQDNNGGHSVTVLRPEDGILKRVVVEIPQEDVKNLNAKYYTFNLSAAEADMFEKVIYNEK